MKISHRLMVLLLVSTAVAQTTPAARTVTPVARTGQTKETGRAGTTLPPDPDLFDGSKFEAENRPEMGMLGEFEMPGGETQTSKVGGEPGQAGGNQAPPNAATSGGSSGGAAGAAGSAGAEGASVDNAAAAGAAGAVGGALDQSKPTGSGSAGQAGAGDPNAKAEGIAADRLEGGGAGGAAAAQNAASQGSRAKSPVSRIGSAELRIEALPETDKDVVGREAAPGGTQGSNREMPAGKGGQGSNNQNRGVEKGKVIPKGL